MVKEGDRIMALDRIWSGWGTLSDPGIPKGPALSGGMRSVPDKLASRPWYLLLENFHTKAWYK